MLASIADTCEHDALARGIVIHTELPDEPAITLADRVRCEQILWNLVSNALKFTNTGGQIDLRLSHEGRMLRLDVIDDGQGIEAATLPYVFDMFRQGARDRSRGGLGIGLALVRQLVEMHGGRINAESGGANLGTRMTVWLPAAVDERTSLASAADENRSVAGLRILLVEDDAETAGSLTALLELEGARVFTAATAPDALRMLGSEPVDAIVSDISLPDMNGYELMRRIRADDRWSGIYTVALTGHDREGDIQAARDAGFDVHLAKPLDFQLLLDTLGALVSGDGA
jgi:two-component system, chemotaxis family, CheB/CheR fusion protein